MGYHDKLTIHSVCHSSVAGDTISKILNFEGSFETAGEESAERSDERGECCKDENVELNRCNGDRVRDRKEFTERVDERWWHFEFAGDKDWIGFAVEP